MTLRATSALALTLVLSAVAEKPPIEWLPERARGGELAKEFFEPMGENSMSKQYWLTVPLNWSAPQGPSFRIRYFIDDSSFNAGDARSPIFLSMGGEGGSSGARCSSLARKHRALCVAVEHRFYGQSVPATGGASNDNYKEGLYIEMNLADTAAVVDAVQKTYSSAGNRPVVNFGGSYSGATCAWFRQAYPTHTNACVSSSGVVNAILDMTQFDTHIASAIGKPNQECTTALHLAMVALERLFDSGSGDKVKKLFNANNLIGTKLGDMDFFYAVADGAAMMDQYGAKSQLCNGLAQLPSSPSDMDRMTNLQQIIARHYGSKFAAGCFYDSECLRKVPGANDLGTINDRSWRWQKCSEFGVLQPAPTDQPAMRAANMTLQALLDQCDYVFGEGTAAAIPARNDKFNAKFGGAKPASGGLPKSSNIFYLDFSDDPWEEASVQGPGPEGSSLEYCMTTCDGCGHCGSGVPSSLHECSDKSNAFVEKVLGSSSSISV